METDWLTWVGRVGTVDVGGKGEGRDRVKSGLGGEEEEEESALIFISFIILLGRGDCFPPVVFIRRRKTSLSSPQDRWRLYLLFSL